MDVSQRISSGDLVEALKTVQQQIRQDPANAKNRVLLFQLQVILGQWNKASTQLDLLKELDQSVQFMVQTYQQVLLCEAIRQDVFAGKRLPMLFAEPEPWIALLLEALRLDISEQHENAGSLRMQALQQAKTVSGQINEQPFEWIADADSRLGPILEAIVNGKYYWIPFQHLSLIQLTAPEDLRDLAWLPAQFVWTNGGEAFGFIPSRYAGSEKSSDSLIQLSRKTEWLELSGNMYQGLGQRMFATDEADYPLLEAREIKFNSAVDGD